MTLEIRVQIACLTKEINENDFIIYLDPRKTYTDNLILPFAFYGDKFEFRADKILIPDIKDSRVVITRFYKDQRTMLLRPDDMQISVSVLAEEMEEIIHNFKQDKSLSPLAQEVVLQVDSALWLFAEHIIKSNDPDHKVDLVKAKTTFDDARARAKMIKSIHTLKTQPQS